MPIEHFTNSKFQEAFQHWLKEKETKPELTKAEFCRTYYEKYGYSNAETFRNSIKREIRKRNELATHGIDYIDSLGRKYGNKNSRTMKLIAPGDTIPPPNTKPAAPPKPEELLQHDRSLGKAQVKAREIEAKYKAAIKLLDEAEARFEHLTSTPLQIERIEQIIPVHSKHINEATAIIQLSDWHFEENVDPRTINGLNEYNPDIAKKRWVKCIQNALKLVEKERQASKIDNLVLWLGGDFITGYIHEELEESNWLSPTEATMFAQERIMSAIHFLLEHGKFQNIHIVCNYGNHGRTNKKPRVSTSYKNSYEWMMYRQLERELSSIPKLHWNVVNGMYAYLNVYDFTTRWFHGDSIGYGGGIGGLTIPLIKAMMRADMQTKADYNFMGHFHQLWQATKNTFVNGSGIGYGPYAQRIGASPELPMQGFYIIDKKHGLTTRLPIFCG